MVQISEVKNQGRDNRTSAHTHIKGLGLSLAGNADKQAAGFVGQQTAREVTPPPRCDLRQKEGEANEYLMSCP